MAAAKTNLSGTARKKLTDLEAAIERLPDKPPVPLCQILRSLGLEVGKGGKRFGYDDARRRVLRDLEDLGRTGRWLIVIIDAKNLPPPVPKDDRGDPVWISFRRKLPGRLL